MSTNGSKTVDGEEVVIATGDPSALSESLGSHSARGLIYLFAGSSATKVVVYVSQILLLYLLDKEDFGVVTLAGTITAFVQLIGQAGIIDVLVHRRAFRQWAIPAFWLALSLGLASCVFIGLSAPLAAKIYGSDPAVARQLFWLLIVSIASPLPYALSVVPKAQLSRQLRFRELMVLNVADITLQNVLTLAFAAMGFGPFSFILPIPTGGLLITAALWWWVRPPWSPRLYLRRWRYLVGDSAQLLASEMGRLLVDQSDYMTLGLFHTAPGLVGIYANGFRLSIQMMRLLAVNMTTILFPAFTKLQDQPQKQYDGFFNAQRILAMVGISGCLLQAAAAEPFARLFFPPKWYPSIVVMQILSLGMATRMVSGGAYALLKSQGRFKTVRNSFWTYAVVQVTMLVAVLSRGGGIVEVSIVVSVLSAFVGPIMFYVAIRPSGGRWADVFDVLARPLVCGILAVGSAWLISQKMTAWADGTVLYLLQLVEICAVSIAMNALLARLWMRPVWDDLWLRIGRLLPRRAAT